jgi:hypothetical protein
MSDAFVTQLDPSQPPQSQLVYSTFLGGSGNDNLLAVALDSSGAMTVGGNTDSMASAPFYPATNGAFNTTPAGANVFMAFVTRLDPAQASAPCQLIYSTYLGGAVGQSVADLVLDANWGAVAVGATQSLNFPTTPGAAFPTYQGGARDAWVTWLDLLPTGTLRMGTPTAGPSGRPVIEVTSQPKVGASCFAVACKGAPPSGAGVIGIAGNVLATPVSACGINVWIDLNALLGYAPVFSNGFGYAQLPLPIPNLPALAGLSAAFQFAWVDPLSAGACTGTAALIATIQC